MRSARLLTAGVLLTVAAMGWSPERRRSGVVQDPVPNAALSEAIRSILDGSGAPLRHFADLQTVGRGLTALYSPTAMPWWTDEGRPTSQAIAAVAFLRHADDEGLVPEDYDAAWLAQQHAALGASRGATTTELALFDVTLSTEVLRYLQAIHQGRVRPRT